ncbi:tRNA-intron lyase [archaeon]|jgi:tRNA-intron endonuclease|nr:tRNA-intron lyase [archaeon]NDB55865.1 tRNA-intron lyase [archaeon]NDB79791.1 tRNA-intron lyase [archaeon]|tara:strand:+ start:366 stop:926 length:561 start_codon:yes stop_codon:yes gene_type:complete
MVSKPNFPPSVILDKESIIIWDEDISSILYSNGYFGKPLGLRKPTPGNLQRPLVLSLFDGLILLENSIISISLNDKNINIDEFVKHANNYYEDFYDKYQVYKYLRDLGYIVRPGMKFGSDFVIYEKGPGIDHSKWVVHIEKDKKELKAIEIVRAGRLAASVKKRYLIATSISKESPKLYSFDRVKI